ncbi:unnamed protein product [Ranitomeya imitator]|uniref:Uncharacterized protein n=1 Tax=Ranitomeya imitator TaxID=111125 RepID=A0ABN9MMG1_9NEOB|nr:unnamed protein product [Ranitomeya imitator]
MNGKLKFCLYQKFPLINRHVTQNDPNTEDERQRRLTEDFHEILEVLETYLSPVMLQLDFSPFRQPSPPLSVTESLRAKSREKDDKAATTSSASVDAGDCIILLADESLQQFPLESLGIFMDDGINSVSRDFSLQLLYNRIHRDHTEDAEGKRDVKSAKESKQRGDQRKNIKTIAERKPDEKYYQEMSKENRSKGGPGPMGVAVRVQRLPSSYDDVLYLSSCRGSDAGVPINRVLPANCMPVDTHGFKCILYQ